jgi:hypothetical protein
MKKVILGSLRRGSGKTSMITGIGRALGGKISYCKPFGERVLYRDKNLWDYDCELMKGIFGIAFSPQELSIGFHHSKMRYMYDKKTTAEKLNELVSRLEAGSDALFIEGGSEMSYGMSVYLDVFTMAQVTGGRLVMVISGNLGQILDDAALLHRATDFEGIEFGGIIINKVQDVYDFNKNHLDKIERMGIKVLGMVPFNEHLGHFSIAYLQEILQARVIAGAANMSNVVKIILIGAMSLNSILQAPVFKEEKKLLITSGDRSDVIISALDGGTSGIVLTNNIIPPLNIISRADDAGVPLLTVPEDTFRAAKKIDDMEIMFTRDETDKIELLTKLTKENLDLKAVLGK